MTIGIASVTRKVCTFLYELGERFNVEIAGVLLLAMCVVIDTM